MRLLISLGMVIIFLLGYLDEVGKIVSPKYPFLGSLIIFISLLIALFFEDIKKIKLRG